MENNLVLFEQNQMLVFESLVAITNKKKELEEKEKSIKEKIKAAMNEYGVKSFKNDLITISNVEGSESVSIDLKELQKKEPKLYKELLEDYPKVSKKAGYVRFMVK